MEQQRKHGPMGWVALGLVLAGVVWLVLSATTHAPAPPAAPPQSSPSAETGSDVPPSVSSTPTVAVEPDDPRPAGEQLRPGQAPTKGESFVAVTRSGQKAKGRWFRAKAHTAPLLVFIGEADDAPNAWQRTLETLRASRDYHLVVVTAPPTETERAARVEASRDVAVLESALSWAQQHLSTRSSPSGAVKQRLNGIGLIGGGRGAAAAVLLAAERRDVLAAVAISAPPRLGSFRLADVLPRLRGRHTYWLAGVDDERTLGTLAVARSLPLAVARSRPGGRRGAALLEADRRAQTSLAGWLFAIMPRAD